jgi:ankyrin repeat protein
MEHPDLVSSKEADGETALHNAAASGHKDIAELLLVNMADINARDKSGLTPLHYALYFGHNDVVGLLLKNKADVNSPAIHSLTPLHLAASLGNYNMVALLLANKADINAKDELGNTPLHYAVQDGYKDVAELLRSKTTSHASDGAVLKQAGTRTKNGQSQHQTTNSKTHTKVSAQIKPPVSTPHPLVDQEQYEEVNDEDLPFDCKFSGSVAVHDEFATITGNISTLRLGLIGMQLFSDIELLTDKIIMEGRHAVIATMWFGKLQFTLGQQQRGPLFQVWATPSQKSRLRKYRLDRFSGLLKDQPSLVSIKDKNGDTLLHMAAANGQKDVVKLLLANAAEVNAKDDAGMTPLSMAAARGHKEVVNLLFANTRMKDVPGLVFGKDKKGDTPLHMAAANGQKDVVELLLAIGEEANEKNDNGLTPLSAARANGHDDVVELLRLHGGHE